MAKHFSKKYIFVPSGCLLMPDATSLHHCLKKSSKNEILSAVSVLENECLICTLSRVVANTCI